MIVSQRRRTHVLHVRLVGHGRTSPIEGPALGRRTPALHAGQAEHLVLAALAQRYLRGEPHPQPLRGGTADVLNRIPGEKEWTPRSVEYLVRAIRDRLAIPYTSREEATEPVGNTLTTI